MTNNLTSYVIPFLTAGFTVAAVKYVATHMNNPFLAAILGGLPIGLLSIYFLQSDKTIPYSKNYFHVTLCLATAILLFFLLQVHTSMDKNICLLIALGVWAVLVFINYMINRKK